MEFSIRSLTEADADLSSQLARESFSQFVAPDWEANACEHFFAHSTPELMQESLQSPAFAAGAFTDTSLLRFILMPRPSFVSMLFVRPTPVRQGIGRQLWECARAHIEQAYPKVPTFELNSSPHAASFYRRRDPALHHRCIWSVTMPVTGFSHYNLRASRVVLDGLRDFYVDVVGLRLGYRPPFKSFGYWLYVGDQALLHLSEASPQEVRPPNVVNTFDHVALSCTGRTEMEARLRQHKVEFTRDEVPLTGQSQLFFSDPAGNGVELNFAQNDA